MKFEGMIRRLWKEVERLSLERHTNCPGVYVKQHPDEYTHTLVFSYEVLRVVYLATLRTAVLNSPSTQHLYKGSIGTFNTLHPSLNDRLRVVLNFLPQLTPSDFALDVAEKQFGRVKDDLKHLQKVIFNEYPSAFYESEFETVLNKLKTVYNYDIDMDDGDCEE